jgi:hypothetical protein
VRRQVRQRQRNRRRLLRRGRASAAAQVTAAAGRACMPSTRRNGHLPWYLSGAAPPRLASTWCMQRYLQSACARAGASACRRRRSQGRTSQSQRSSCRAAPRSSGCCDAHDGTHSSPTQPEATQVCRQPRYTGCTSPRLPVARPGSSSRARQATRRHGSIPGKVTGDA